MAFFFVCLNMYICVCMCSCVRVHICVRGWEKEKDKERKKSVYDGYFVLWKTVAFIEILQEFFFFFEERQTK